MLLLWRHVVFMALRMITLNQSLKDIHNAQMSFAVIAPIKNKDGSHKSKLCANHINTEENTLKIMESTINVANYTSCSDGRDEMYSSSVNVFLPDLIVESVYFISFSLQILCVLKILGILIRLVTFHCYVYIFLYIYSEPNVKINIMSLWCLLQWNKKTNTKSVAHIENINSASMSMKISQNIINYIIAQQVRFSLQHNVTSCNEEILPEFNPAGEYYKLSWQRSLPF